VFDSQRFAVGFFAVGDKESAGQAFSFLADAFLQNLPEVSFYKATWKREGAR